MKRLLNGGTLRMLAVAAIVAVVSGGTVAVAAQMITSKDIKNNTIKLADLSKKVRKKLNRATVAAGVPGGTGAAGAPGANGTSGATGATGATGSAVYVGPNWNLIDRNTEGSPDVELRVGPTDGPNAKPPLGVGSLGIVTASNTEKAAFGNTVDFLGQPVSGLSQVGFSYFVTGEDLTRYAGNTPNITLEINPHVGGKTYTSMVYTPPNPTLPAGQGSAWVNEDADTNPGGTSGWYFTNGTVSSTTGCTQATFCSLAQAKAALAANQTAPATIFSVALAKGKDYQYQGAVDALRINNEVFDFEPFGVTTTTP